MLSLIVGNFMVMSFLLITHIIDDTLHLCIHLFSLENKRYTLFFDCNFLFIHDHTYGFSK